MLFKLLDISLIADKSLDIYARTSASSKINGELENSPTCVHSHIMKIFESVFEDAARIYSSSYDITYVIVPCYPMMRASGECHIESRLFCSNSPLLAKYGISSNQFLELFEKFIRLKCGRRRKTVLNGGKTVVLNEKKVLFSDWKRIIMEHYGSSLVDAAVTEPFSENPKIIARYEGDDCKYSEIDEFTEYKAKKLL